MHDSRVIYVDATASNVYLKHTTSLPTGTQGKAVVKIDGIVYYVAEVQAPLPNTHRVPMDSPYFRGECAVIPRVVDAYTRGVSLPVEEDKPKKKPKKKEE